MLQSPSKQTINMIYVILYNYFLGQLLYAFIDRTVEDMTGKGERKGGNNMRQREGWNGTRLLKTQPVVGLHALPDEAWGTM